ncbi:hypothetical protein PIB30_011516 [Stylosanthes scabra]|uniref:Uncharacterized protein n=1 Tax=Stylosanthes scabra TaxID=79078 RepID=A0ABU6T5N4_9FABA|nr:hypothetical protein [Stylosanthes scabra]
MHSGRPSFRRKLSTRSSSRRLRQLSKLEPVPEKSDDIRSENPNPWILSTDKGPNLQLVAGTLAGGPPAATVSRDVSFCPTWKQKPHSHLLLPMVRCYRKPSSSPLDPS